MTKIFKQVNSHPLFIEGARLAVECGFECDEKFFSGDDELFSQLKKSSQEEYWSLLKDHPFPYFSICEKVERPAFLTPEIIKNLPDPDLSFDDYSIELDRKNIALNEEERIKTFFYSRSKGDNKTRQHLLDRAKDKNCLEWWIYIHNCDIQALFLTLPALKILYPHKEFYLAFTDNHVVVTNTKTMSTAVPTELTLNIDDDCVFDPISQVLDTGSLDWYWSSKWNIKEGIEGIVRIVPSRAPFKKIVKWLFKLENMNS